MDHYSRCSLTGRQMKTYTGNTTLTLLDLNPMPVVLGYEPSDHSYTGEFTYDGKVLDVTNPKIKIKYSKKKGFEVVEWPVPAELQGALDVVNGIEQASKTTGTTKCGALTNIVLNIFKTDFSLKVALGGSDSKKADKKVLDFYISGKFTIYVHKDEANITVADIDIPQLQGSLETFKANNLRDAIKELLISNAESLGKQIIRNPVAFAKLFGAIAVADIGPRLLEKAICRKIKTKNVEDKAKQEVEIQENSLKEKFAEVENALETAGKAASVSAVAGALGAAEAALAELTPLVTGLVAFLGSFAAFFGVDSADRKKYEDMEHKAKTLQDELQKKVAKSSAAIKSEVLQMQGSPACIFVSGDKLRVDWTHIRPKKENFSYEDYRGVTWTVTVSLSGKDNGQTNHDVPVKDQTSTEIKDSQFQYTRTVYAWVKATYTKDGKGKFSGKPSDHGSASHVPCLMPPKVTFASKPGQCTVTIDPAKSEQYRLEIAGADDQTRDSILYNQNPATLSQGSLIIPWMELKVPESLPSSVRAYVQRLSSDPKSYHDSPWVHSTQGFRLAPVPQDLTAEMNSSSEKTYFDVEWNQQGVAPDPVDYNLQVLDAGSNQSITSVEKTPQPTQTGHRKVRLSSPEFKPGLEIVITVRVLHSDNDTITLTACKHLKIAAPPSCEFLPLGALIQRFRVGNRNIVLGYDSQNKYVQFPGIQFGKTIGRVSNRIEGGNLKLNGRHYELPLNDKHINTNDGGNKGWGKCIFQGPSTEKRNGLDATLFTYRSVDGEEGFPGEVEIKVWYMESHGPSTLAGKPTTMLTVEYEAALTSAATTSTVINVTNRRYVRITTGDGRENANFDR